MKASSYDNHYYEYAVVHFQDCFIYFGGDGSSGYSVIAKFDSTTREWSNIGHLITGRMVHGAIFDGSYFLVIGGFDDYYQTEKCSFSGSTMTCTQQQPDLYRYQMYPELFLVPNDFCKNT